MYYYVEIKKNDQRILDLQINSDKTVEICGNTMIQFMSNLNNWRTIDVKIVNTR